MLIRETLSSFWLALVSVLLASAACGFAAPADDARARKIVLIAGPITGHPKDAHEYERSVILLKELLDTSPSVKGLRTEIHLGGWPADDRSLDDADTVVLISDGGDHREVDHPLYVGNRLEVIEKQLRRGCGLVNLHWSTFHPARFHERITEWIGGYFDYETGSGQPPWFSKIEHGQWKVGIESKDHPILRGVRPFELQEEFYYKIRFRERDPRLVPLLGIDRGTGSERLVAWAVERADGGRGVGFTGGHFFDNWRNSDFRRFVLNAIVWSARVEVPKAGVDSELEEPWRALIVTGHNHPAHDWRAVTAALIPVLEQDPRARIDVTEKPEDLAADDLARYQVLVLNYCNWDRPGLSQAARDGLVRYLEGGGGLSVIHFANGAFNRTLPATGSDWEEYRTRIVRRVWTHGDGHSGHDAFGPFKVQIRDPSDPVTAGLAPFKTLDELYFKQEGTEPIRILATAHSASTNADEPMAWTYTERKGRAFQTVLGHSDESIRKAAALIRRGTTWAAGRKLLSFDPPTGTLEKYLFRPGETWSPEASRAQEKEPGPKKSDQRTGGGGTPEREPPKKTSSILPQNPGIDGGVGGHWGVKSDDDWADGRWAESDIGPFLTASLETAAGTIPKAICIRVGAGKDGAVCFDSDALTLRAGWLGPFLTLGAKRFGLIEMPRIPVPTAFDSPPGDCWTDAAGAAVSRRYRSLRLNGERVVLEHEVGGVLVRESPWLESLDGFAFITRALLIGPASQELRLRLFQARESGSRLARWRGDGNAHVDESREGEIDLTILPHDGRILGQIVLWAGPPEDVRRAAEVLSRLGPIESPNDIARPGPRRWGDPIATRGELGTGPGPYTIDTVTVPYENPHRALFFLSGHDFFFDGSAAVATVHGDVWIVRGISEKLERLTWQRFATGLYQPLGLRIVDDVVHVLGRDQITRLRDLNGDGEADEYECFSAAPTTLAGRHEYSTCLETDPEGNFYYASPQGLHRVAKDGSSPLVIATGWRNPNGLGVGPDGTITVAPQEGEWTPASQISQVKPGGYYGYPGPKKSPERPLGYDPPLCWIPRPIDNSTGGQVWVTGDRWGPLAGQLLNLSFGRSSFQLVLRDLAAGIPQGGLVPLKGRFLSGAMRGRFREQDGQLYVTGLMGWVTNAVLDGCFQRVRYSGGKVYLPTGFEARSNGIRLDFTEPLERQTAEDVRSFSAEAWNYRYAAEYGSQEYSPSHPGEVGHDPVALSGAYLLEGGRSVFLEMPALRPVHQMQVRGLLRAADGADFSFDFYPTIHALGPRFDVSELETARDDAADPEIPAQGPRGLSLTLTETRTKESDTQVARLAALRVLPGSTPSAFLDPGPFRAAWTGQLNLPETGTFRFSAAGRGAVKLALDEAVLLDADGEDLATNESQWKRLRRGPHAFKLEYDSPAEGEAWIRLYWQGRDFGRETIPPQRFSHDANSTELIRGRALRRGRELVAELRCLKCHELQAAQDNAAAGMSELDADSPSFDGIGDRLEPAWMARWIAAPRSLKPSASMPDFFDGSGPAEAFPRGDTRPFDLAAYLATLRTPGSERPGVQARREIESEIRMGGELFARLGCIACHLLPEDPRASDDAAAAGGTARLGLGHSRSKWKPGALAEYLEKPHRHFRWARMPDFKLTGAEARALSAFLISKSPAALAAGTVPESRAPVGDARAGSRLVAELRCARCHATAARALNEPRAPSLEEIASLDWARTGCAAARRRPSTAPHYGLEEADRAAIAEFARTALASLARRDLVGFAERQIASLRCGACHERDGIESGWAKFQGETDAFASHAPSAITVQARPSITLAGEQLENAWLRRSLTGGLGYTLRPWLDARMPCFPAQGDALARGLALEHGVSLEPEPVQAPSEEGPRIGKRLLSTSGGLSCVTCHSVGGEKAQMQLHFGVINLGHARERLRKEHFLRWLMSPQRLAPLTMMPAYSDEDGRSALAGVLGGDARAQFEAVWEYLSTVR